jgi:hypothetical protein
MSDAVPNPARALVDLMRASGMTPPTGSVPNVDEVLRRVQEQRELIRTTVANLEALDAQLAVLEATLAPFAATVRFWEGLLGMSGPGKPT